MRIAISSAHSLADVLIDRVARVAARASAPTWSTPGKPWRKRRRSDSERPTSAKMPPRSRLPAPDEPPLADRGTALDGPIRGRAGSTRRGRHRSLSNCHLSDQCTIEPNGRRARPTRARGPAHRLCARSSRAAKGECRGGNDEHDRARGPLRGRPAPTGHRSQARARALAPDAGEHGRDALRQLPLGGEGAGGARRLRRVAPAKGRPGALLRGAARRGPRDR